MHAQTHLQLFDEMRAMGYSDGDLIAIDRVYAYARELFSGVHRGSGKPFSCHLVGTASALVSLRAPVSMVAAGLLHAAYERGDFGAGWFGRSDLKRAQVREHVGNAIEDLIDRYAQHPWGLDTPRALVERLDNGSDIDREVVIIRLANELDDHRDLGILYCRDAAERLLRVQRIRAAVVELAQRLDQDALSRALAEAFEQCLSAQVPEQLRTTHDVSFAVPTISRSRWRMWRLWRMIRNRRRTED